MSARGFKPVGWVAAVAGAALGCYMLSLNVAAERAELAKVERRIIAAKQNIRSLQTELGTRGRLSQLEEWNAEVLALAAPVSAQYLDSEMTLARFDQNEETFEERAKVRMASAEAPTPASSQKIVAPVIIASAPARNTEPRPMVRQASYVAAEARPTNTVKPAAGPVSEKPEATRLAAAKPLPVKAAAAKPIAAKQFPAKATAAKPEIKLAALKPARAKAAAKPERKASLLDDRMIAEIGETAKTEKKDGSAGGR